MVVEVSKGNYAIFTSLWVAIAVLFYGGDRHGGEESVFDGGFEELVFFGTKDIPGV